MGLRGAVVVVLWLAVTGHTTAVPGSGYDYDYHAEPLNNAIPIVKEVVDYYAKPKYAFGYEVDDYYNQLSHGRWEIRDGDVTQGQYRVLLPDGRIQIVSYIADKGGYRPTIQYIGKGAHPPPPPAYAHVKAPFPVVPVPAYTEPEPFVAAAPIPAVVPVPAATPIPVSTPAPYIHAEPSVAPYVDVGPGPAKIRVNPAAVAAAIPVIAHPPLAIHQNPVAIPVTVNAYGYAGGYGHGYGLGPEPGYEPIFAASSKVSKKRALLYDRTLFRKDVEQQQQRKKKRRVVKIPRALIAQPFPVSTVATIVVERKDHP